MATEWRTARVADLVARGDLLISDGYRVRNEELGPEGVPFVRGGDICDGWINTTVEDHVRPEFGDRIRPKVTRPGDVAFIIKGTVGRAGRLRDGQPPAVFAPQVAWWRVLEPSALDPTFLYYLIRAPAFQASLYGVKTHGSMVADYVSISQQLEFQLTLPPVEEQRRIAGVLGALDDKIELNRSMNETLEATTRALFKSWFVDFDPVRAKSEGRDPGLPPHLAGLFPDAFEDSVLGEIPEGWRTGRLGDIAENRRRGVNPASIDPQTPYIGLERMPRRSVTIDEWGTAGSLESGKHEFRRGEILFGKLRPYLHKVGVAPVDGVCSTDIVVIRPRTDAEFGLVLSVVSSDAFVDYANANSTGTRMPRTNWADMARFPCAIPTEPVSQAFTDRVQRATDRIVAAIHESRGLAALRDAMLPSLVSGDPLVPGSHHHSGRAG